MVWELLKGNLHLSLKHCVGCQLFSFEFTYEKEDMIRKDGVHCWEIILVVQCRVVFRKVELVKIFRKVVKLILGHSMNVLLYFFFYWKTRLK